MKKKILSFGDQQVTIAELNTAQVEEIISFKPSTEENPPQPDWTEEQKADWQKRSKAEWDARRWRTILLSINNAVNPPTKENPLGSDTEPQSFEDYKPILGYKTIPELHTEVLHLSGLRSSGESTAAPSTSDTSTAASSR